MDKSISQMMAKAVRTVDTEDTIEKVDATLTSHGLSAAPVVDASGAVFGIISSHDLLHFHAAKKNPHAVRAWELCTYKPLTVAPATPVREVAELMVKHRIHHVLIMDGTALIGIVSALDFVEQYVLKQET